MLHFQSAGVQIAVHYTAHPHPSLAGTAIAVPLYPVSYYRDKRDKRDTKIILMPPALKLISIKLNASLT